MILEKPILPDIQLMIMEIAGQSLCGISGFVRGNIDLKRELDLSARQISGTVSNKSRKCCKPQEG